MIGFVVLVLPMTWGLTHLSYDLPFLLRPNQPVRDVVVVYMDEHSEERLGTGRWEAWDRTWHARLLRVLTQAGARAVAFDVLFRGGTNESANAQLVAAARAQGKVAVATRPGSVLSPEGVRINTLLKPFSQLEAVAKVGMAEGVDETGAIRKHVQDRDFGIPSLAWRVAELTLSSLPADPFASRWINYYGPAGHLPHVSYSDIFETNFPITATFSNKVVFVGASWVIGFTGGLGTDDHRTPHTLLTERRMPGVEVCATTYLNLARGDWLNRLSPYRESGLIVLVGWIVGLGLSRLEPKRALAFGLFGMVLVPALAFALMWSTRYWFPWLIVAGIQLPIGLSCSLFQYTRQLQRDKRVLEQSAAFRAGASPIELPPELQPVRTHPNELAQDVLPSPVGIGSSARPSGPSAAVNDLIRPTTPPLSPAVPQPGQAPAVPDHQLLRRIGRGAYGEVWIGRDIIGSFHAIKLVFRDAFKEAEPFDREFKGLSRFTPISRNHPGLVHVLQVGRNDTAGYLYYVMELADDVTPQTPLQPETYAPRTLSSLLRDGQRIPLTECLDLAIRLADALQFLHQHHLIHRDIKPSNVIFVNGAPKFADIGLVTDVAATDHDVSYLGTKGYIAPEGPGTPAADVYSLGKVIYQMGFGLEVGRFPELPTSVVIDPDETALFGLNHIVMRACEASAAARYQTAAELSAALVGLRRQLVPPRSVG
jgi:CHASE2 domain-containing sensor protein